jgi:glycerol-3-phosphate dehydrogenase
MKGVIITDNSKVNEFLLKQNSELLQSNKELLEALEYSLSAIKAINSFGATKPIIARIEQLIQKHKRQRRCLMQILFYQKELHVKL